MVHCLLSSRIRCLCYKWRPSSQFPYFTAIAQLWHSWDESKQLAQAEPDNTTKTILWTIAVSFTIEYSLTGVYENTIGRISEWLHFGHKTVEDMYIDAQAVQYGNFLNQEPWYEFPYLSTLNGLWKTWGWSSFSPRGIERRIAYTVGYASKSLYASIIRALSQANFEGGAGLITKVTVIASENQVTILQLPFKSLPEINHYFVEFPRYRAFRDPAVAVAQSGAEFKDIEGHDYISLSVVMDTLNACDAILQADGYSMSIPSQPKLSRYVLSTPVSELTNTINSILDCNYQIEHIYDY